MPCHHDPCYFTSGNADEVLPGGFVDLDVPVADVVLVAPDGHVTVVRVLEQDQGLAVASALIAQTQSYPASEKSSITHQTHHMALPWLGLTLK